MNIKVMFDEKSVIRTLARLSHEIIEKNDHENEICIIGIRSRGVSIAKILAENVRSFSDIKVNLGELDISLHRDDVDKNEVGESKTKIDFSVTGKTVILVDDVLYTGRTVRAALDAIVELGRPSCIQLCVLVDRGHREFPVHGDFVGKNIPTSRNEKIVVNMSDYDNKISIELLSK
ncbi:MAG: bifunctional pyr operon transcriptional regulator/uracil phosphoribosyltransferase PyrR [Acutalibacteraceae bacterium]|nr:bifunctional pyr operon transcriptional regulator/uracil phosphoribosyltransferase PyrR [Clostridia bacterium]MBQ5597528.1 bifunctional pyr operon transcriptional regulator/uracil phosphoribosyltransferase PyrR [Clostridia bacterium]MEE1127272.1 bifunctional pyr operon transcriptional regulator/uracil phosphoribosyltransferase PyrR [Acutalibacteraceae bacterium]